MDWDKLRTFHIVAEAGSFTHAGNALDLSQSAVSRQISALEESLDTKLFHRHARGLVLTEAGELLSSTASEIFGKLSMVQARLLDDKSQPSGTLRITSPGFLGSTWLVPRLSELHAKYPELQLSLLFDDRIYNLNMREADAAIRLYKPDQPDLLYSKIGEINFHIFGSKNYFKKNGVPETAADLKDHILLGYPDGTPAPFEDPNWLFRQADTTLTNNAKLIKINSIYGIYEAVRNDAGLAVLPDYLAATDSNIESCLTEIERPSVDMYFVYSEERQTSNRIKLLKQFLTDTVKDSKF